ncbi:MAG TPA: transcriptional regulator NrdR [Dehalococcoidia bacterium]|jgi:transcriptional repressor NrdR|nr:transcriptional regulator NrdR [Dehalococcoidia bacterium]|tara:strand:+ start:639 stop:1085 length:447 start_codon:yes stop_codon:yes gene_type:complete
MNCPYCKNDDLKVIDSRSDTNSVRRRRECTACAKRFTTYERIENYHLMVSKQDGRREDFNRSKLINGLTKACAKRPISMADIERIVNEIENEFTKTATIEISSTKLGEVVMAKLKELDRVAYIRWASVYRDFQDVESFQEVVSDLLQS